MKLSTQVKQPHMVASFLMNDITRICRQLIDRHMGLVGLNRAQWYLLNFIYMYDGLSQQELADLMDLGKGNIAAQIHRLEEKGWIRREAHEKDGRSFRVYMHVKMKPTIRKLNKLAELSLQKILSGLDDRQIEQFIDVLRSIDGQFEQELSSDQPLKGPTKKLVDEINIVLKAEDEK